MIKYKADERIDVVKVRETLRPLAGKTVQGSFAVSCSQNLIYKNFYFVQKSSN